MAAASVKELGPPLAATCFLRSSRRATASAVSAMIRSPSKLTLVRVENRARAVKRLTSVLTMPALRAATATTARPRVA